MDIPALQALLQAQQRIIERIALGTPLETCLREIALAIEAVMGEPDAAASILLLDGQRVRHGAGPSLSPVYLRLIDGLEIGPRAGSCGTAMYRREPVVVTDIAHDPLWADYRDLALDFDLRACWSQPILTAEGEVLGSFAIYYRHVASPTPDHLTVIRCFSDLARLAIERARQAVREQRLLSEVEQGRNRLQAIASVIPDATLVLDADGRYVDIYGGEPALLAAAPAQLLGRRVDEVLPPDLAATVQAVISATLRTGRPQIVEYELDVLGGQRTFEGRTARIDSYRADAPEFGHVVWSARDITERKQAERQIEALAFYDPLTRLPNRQLLMDRLRRQLQHLQRDKTTGALLFLDLDDFKRINDSLGHQYGDQLLTLVAERLGRELRTADTFARLGGDEFVVLLDQTDHDTDRIAAQALCVAQKLLAALAQPFPLARSAYRIHGSIGICVFDAADADPNEVLRRADAAMYHAKAREDEHWAYFNPRLQAMLDRRMQLERDLHQGIERGDFTAHFQPQFHRDGQLLGCEALIRWQHPELGLLMPASFIPVAERCAAMHALLEVVLRAACRLLQALEAGGQRPPGFSVSINLSPVQFLDGRLEEILMRVLEAEGQPPGAICLELTEGTLVGDLERARTQMQRLRTHGFALAIDDFGTGYASLAYLQQLPLDELKIDQCFVSVIDDTTTPTPIIDAIVALAGAMGYRVVAEGVETEHQARTLIARGVHGLQGYHLGRPMAAAKFLDWCQGPGPAGRSM